LGCGCAVGPAGDGRGAATRFDFEATGAVEIRGRVASSEASAASVSTSTVSDCCAAAENGAVSTVFR